MDPPPFEQTLFYRGLREHDVGPDDNTEIYGYYRERHVVDFKPPPPEDSQNHIHQILLADVSDGHTHPDFIDQWTRGKEPIGKGAYGHVWLWQKQPDANSNNEPTKLAVKDVQLDKFWKDYPSEAIILRKLFDVGCRTVVTVHDWMYKGRSRHDEPQIIRIVEEFAEYGDLHHLLLFYVDNKLIIPEAFLWHVFWSGANALCYCRHGTAASPNTIRRWHPITHMDVKPENFVLTKPDSSSADDDLYPNVKLADFGGAYTLPEEGHAVLKGWKSTFLFGTEQFMAPEVIATNPRTPGEFPHVVPSALHGSHTDIFSLGMTILDLMTQGRVAVTDYDGVQTQYVDTHYSGPLYRLVDWCTKHSTENRPSAYELLQKTLEGLKVHQRIARKEKTDAPEDHPFHSHVLYTPESQLRFKRDPLFRIRYEIVNRAPLKNGIKTADPGEPVALTTPSLGNDDDDLLPPDQGNDARGNQQFIHVEIPLATQNQPQPPNHRPRRPRKPRRPRPVQAGSPRRNPPRQARATKAAPTTPAASTTLKPRGRPPNQTRTPQKAKTPATAKPKPKRKSKPRRQPPKQANKISKAPRTTTRTTRTRTSPPPKQTISITRVPLIKPYTASSREPPFLPGRNPPVPETIDANEDAGRSAGKGGRKRKSDDDDADGDANGRRGGGKRRGGKRVEFNMETIDEEEEAEEDEVVEKDHISISSGEESDGDEDE
ncbi:MAG: hypothetical protein Q9169_006934 [Polycauliona sp. 2 TL-2023]